MPVNLRVSSSTVEIFEQLRSDTLLMHDRWKLFRQLYADEQGDRLALLRETASNFFYIVQWLFLHDVCLSLSRLTDPPRTAARHNLVLEMLIDAAETDSPGDPIGATLRAALARLRVATEPMRALRNRSIAHRDLRAAENPADNPLPGISRAAVEEALAAVVVLLNAFEVWYTDSRTRYRFPDTQTDGRWVLWALERARRYERLENEGKAPPTDIPPLHVGLDL